MKCPNCTDVTLVSRHRRWLRVDLCPSCQGSWLDQIELERLLSAAQQPRSLANELFDHDHDDHEEDTQRNWRQHDRYHDRNHDRYNERDKSRAWRDDDDHPHGTPYQRRSWLDHVKDFID